MKRSIASVSASGASFERRSIRGDGDSGRFVCLKMVKRIAGQHLTRAAYGFVHLRRDRRTRGVLEAYGIKRDLYVENLLQPSYQKRQSQICPHRRRLGT